MDKDDNNSNIINEAIFFAVKAHEGTFRKGKKTPYIFHPLEAASIVSTMTDSPDIIAAAVLHDVLEDTDITYDYLKEKFGHIADLVSWESENKRRDKAPEETWNIRKKETVKYFQTDASIESKIIALGDKLANMRSIYRDYQLLGDNLWERFHQKDKNKQGWYYKSMAEALKDLETYPAYKEFKALVDLIF
jgi:(p)ppGpp synthase/HD superfamily hydrolase